MSLILKFTNTDHEEFVVRYDGKPVITVAPGETVDLPVNEARAGARDLADRILGRRAKWGTWKEDLEVEKAKILGETPVAPAASNEDDEVGLPEAVQLEDLSLKELKDKVVEAGLEVPKGAKKADLIEILKAPADEEFPE